jgi:hypothetical protein
LDTSLPLFISTSFNFTWTNPDKTLLGRSDTVTCPTNEEQVAAIRAALSGERK